MGLTRKPGDNEKTDPIDMPSDNYLNHHQSMGMVVRRLRIMNGCSQKDLSQLSFTDTSYLGSIEKGKNKVSSLKTILLCGTLSIGEDKFFRISKQITYSANLYKARYHLFDEQGDAET